MDGEGKQSEMERMLTKCTKEKIAGWEGVLEI
jgi:hypothetical protein